MRRALHAVGLAKPPARIRPRLHRAGSESTQSSCRQQASGRRSRPMTPGRPRRRSIRLAPTPPSSMPSRGIRPSGGGRPQRSCQARYLPARFRSGRRRDPSARKQRPLFQHGLSCEGRLEDRDKLAASRRMHRLGNPCPLSVWYRCACAATKACGDEPGPCSDIHAVPGVRPSPGHGDSPCTGDARRYRSRWSRGQPRRVRLPSNAVWYTCGTPGGRVLKRR